MADSPAPARPRRPDKHTYFLILAIAARSRADCLGRRVGAVITREDRVLSTGYNGTPFGMPNCTEGGCRRCAQRDLDTSLRGGAYDVCICVHAEQNALLTAARFGQQTLGASITSTMQPCFGCLKELLQAGIERGPLPPPLGPGGGVPRPRAGPAVRGAPRPLPGLRPGRRPRHGHARTSSPPSARAERATAARRAAPMGYTEGEQPPPHGGPPVRAMRRDDEEEDE